MGGGIRNLKDIQTALNSGADKVSINTQAIKTPTFISMHLKSVTMYIRFIEAKLFSDENWYVYYDNSKSNKIHVVEWAQKLEKMGAGELLVTSVDMEGTKKGFDIN